MVLNWRTQNAAVVTIDGIGQVNLNGTQTVSPSNSTNFHLTAKGDGGTIEANVRVTVRVPVAPTVPPPTGNIPGDMGTDEAFHQNVQDAFFDYDSADLRPDAQAAIAQAASYLAAHPAIRVVIGGYCDDRGSAEYNLALGESRANAARDCSGFRRRRSHPPPRHQLRQGEAVLHRRHRELLAGEPPRPVLDRSLTLHKAVQPVAPSPARAGQPGKPGRSSRHVQEHSSTTPALILLPHNAAPQEIAARRLVATWYSAAALLFAAPAFAAPSKEIIELQQQIKDLQDAVAHLQQSNDERMGVMKDLVQQSADAVNRMSVNLDAMQKRMLGQQEAQSGKVDQVSGQIQSLNDSLDELKARLSRLEKLTQDIQNQQQSMSANLQNIQQPGGAVSAPPTRQLQQPLAPSARAQPVGKKGKGSSAAVPATTVLPPTPPTEDVSAAPPADELYKTALGDYMTAKYALAASEFGDVVKFYPENPLAGNAYYYQAEIDYRAGKYPAAIKNYDQVLEQYPDSSKVPVSHLHKGQALIALKQTDAGVRELRLLIQRFPASPEAMSARSKLSGMGIPVTPRTATARPTAPPVE